ncbi:hypothetical protein S7711_10998 [Stachybotrys chartarum IBT 7711]|uniref:Uncharacterized protein n=1 Tax=Stachybotrys chartarum (strain CBS 109288 / IBT 7711) TaxID=1280523 RepID=A0A084AQ68_STACB|nr:hypothetical protein S7711_10998 [Stachybotrys chartarum IBT 7711]
MGQRGDAPSLSVGQTARFGFLLYLFAWARLRRKEEGRNREGRHEQWALLASPTSSGTQTNGRGKSNCVPYRDDETASASASASARAPCPCQKKGKASNEIAVPCIGVREQPPTPTKPWNIPGRMHNPHNPAGVSVVAGRGRGGRGHGRGRGRGRGVLDGPTPVTASTVHPRTNLDQAAWQDGGTTVNGYRLVDGTRG